MYNKYITEITKKKDKTNKISKKNYIKKDEWLNEEKLIDLKRYPTLILRKNTNKKFLNVSKEMSPSASK